MREYPRNLWVLAIGMMINVTGTSFLWPLNTIYISEVLGHTLRDAGFVLLLNSGANLLGNLLGGALYDRIGGKKTIFLGVILSCLSVIALAYNREWYFYISMMILLGFSGGLVFPAIYAMANGVWPEGGRKAFNVIYVSQNVGVAIGSALGGIVSMFSFTYVFLANALTYFIFLLIIWLGLDNKLATQPRDLVDRGEKKQAKGQVELRTHRLELYALSLLSYGFMAVWLGYVQLQTTVSVYMESMGITRAHYSSLWAINGALILLLQPFLSRLVNRYMSSITAQLLIGGSLFTVSILYFSQQTTYLGFVAGMVVITIGEMLVWPAIPTAVAYLSPPGKSGLYQGIASGAATIGKMIGPYLGGILYDSYNYTFMMLVMVVIVATSLVSFFFYSQVGRRREKELQF